MGNLILEMKKQAQGDEGNLPEGLWSSRWESDGEKKVGVGHKKEDLNSVQRLLILFIYFFLYDCLRHFRAWEEGWPFAQLFLGALICEVLMLCDSFPCRQEMVSSLKITMEQRYQVLGFWGPRPPSRCESGKMKKRWDMRYINHFLNTLLHPQPIH